ncbi:DUF6351 family protein [Ferrimonas balearica]|uniref:DUF6351 family protein n=1 Tax=Ferrimonas balearica TaxID=44012 RepID=UPI001C577900|nr:DUF6351 family protein [Ferrimonas balearica]MBW3163486.1 hypothetical protein [Ferrimonas balearica]
MKPVVLAVVLSLLLVVVGLVCWGQYKQLTHPYVRHQVGQVPEHLNDPPPLAVQRHLMLTERPPETASFPIALGETGPVVPLYAGARQYPFFCMTHFSSLGQPLVDNLSGEGVPVYAEDDNGLTDQVIGYARDCQLPTALSYWYVDAKGRVLPWSEQVNESDIARVERGGESVPELYRLETGTINRYPYYIAMPYRPGAVRTDTPDWNGRLIYQFHGGSGIGFRQGRLRPAGFLTKRLQQLRRGYAVISSTGNKTAYTYNMLLAEDTARRVKRQFVSLYGAPRYTIGIGGSGGGLAQYLMMQNGSGVIDGALALYAYPDMLSQTLYGLDCDLLNTYYAFRADQPELWQNFDVRPSVEGLNAAAGFDQRAPFLEPLNQLLQGRWPRWPSGSSECINGWFGLSSLIHNPHQGYIRPMFHDDVVEGRHWSYWEDLHQIFGRDEDGFARTTWDNRGVQYGLAALQQGQLSVRAFLHLNRRIGGWVPARQMEAETLWAPLGKLLPLWLTLWGNHNVHDGEFARRTEGDPVAIERAYRSGQVFLGYNPLPVIDLRHYLEDQLDMHHLSASFEARARIQQWHGHHDNQLIWVADKDHTPMANAFDAMERWLEARQRGEGKPADLTDQCFAADGSVIARGEAVWDGPWNGRESGPCTVEFPAYTNARIQAGGPWLGAIFQCHRIAVADALEAGLYQDDRLAAHRAELERIFPEGVCDYRQGDAARPADLSPQALSASLAVRQSGDDVQGDGQAVADRAAEYEQVPDRVGIGEALGGIE